MSLLGKDGIDIPKILRSWLVTVREFWEKIPMIEMWRGGDKSGDELLHVHKE